ncbi:hypothetical protein [Bartonella pachyuromydis]|uniref:hypothetical protein n=1 Tax=Bartonella pachyuromydis TaxID=931097 RepID=UPI0031E74094
MIESVSVLSQLLCISPLYILTLDCITDSLKGDNGISWMGSLIDGTKHSIEVIK